jgi:hypothetical protein
LPTTSRRDIWKAEKEGTVTEKERRMLASEEAKALVARLRESNERATARGGAPRMDDSEYSNLQRVVTRKLRQRAA